MTFVQLIQDYARYGGVAFVVTLLMTPVMIVVARRAGVMDVPDRTLKPHARPTPYLGGVAIGLGWLAAMLSSLILGKMASFQGGVFLVGGVAMMAIGLLDDLRDLSPKLRLGAGALIIGAVLVSTGTGFKLVNAILGPVGFANIPDAIAVPLSVLLGVFIVLGACNSTNLIDGLDGLSSGVTAIISLGFFLLAAHLATWKPEEEGHYVRLVLAAGMLGATLGFLPLNFNPAKIFMGDAGSVLLGYNCGIMILLFAEWANFRWVLGAFVIFALPIFDTALAMFRRWNSCKPIFQGDRSHFYDQLVQRGLSVRSAVIVCYGLAVLYALIGLGLTQIQLRYGVPTAAVVVAATAFAAYKVGMTHPDSRTPAESGPLDAVARRTK